MLAVPAHQLYRHGRYKHILRQGLSDLLPPSIRERVEPSNLTPLFRRGILQREISFVRSLLLARDSRWQQYVHKKYILPLLEKPGQLGVNAVLLWQCISFEAWIKRHHLPPILSGKRSQGVAHPLLRMER
jgi:asparagine synthetase B (glutamine-hydrolysing)